MKTTLIFMSLVILFLSSNIFSQQPDSWQWMNPRPQGNSIFAVDFVDNSNGYAGGRFGTFMKTSDGGNNWTNVLSGTSKYIFSIHFINVNTGFIGGERQMMKKTTNGGQTWTTLNLPVETYLDTLLEVLDINFVTPNIGYATGHFTISSKLWKTTNGGLNWVSQNIDGATYLKKFFFHDENNGFAVGGPGGSEIIKTTNGGVNWQLINNVPGIGMEGVYFINTSTGFAGGTSGNVIMTMDAGNTWQTVGSPSSMDITSVVFINASTGFGFGKSDGFVKTINGGLNWTSESFGFGQSNEYYDAEVTPNGTIHSAGLRGVMIRSTNQGTSFFTHEIVTTKSLSDIDFVNTLTGYAVCDAPSGDILKTTNSGLTWVSLESQYSTGYRSVSFVNANTGFITGNLTVKKTTNGGVNWVDIISHPSNNYWGVTFLNDNTGFVVGSGFGTGPFVSKTTNAGLNWLTTSFEPGFNALTTIQFTDLNNGYAVGGGGIAIRTTDGGANWFAMSLPNTSFSSVFFADQNTGYVSSFFNGIFKSTNGGNSWFSLNVPSGEMFYDVKFTGNIGYSVTNSGKIVKTIDGGSTWNIQPTVTENPLYALYVNSDNYIYAGGSGGTMIKTIPAELILTPVSGNSNETPDNFYLGQNYPNPFNPVTTIKFGIVKSGNVQIKVYDVAGRIVDELVNNSFNPGSYEVKWYASKYSSGIYFYSIVTNDFTQTKKMVLVK